MIRIEEVLCELTRLPEFRQEVIVHSFVNQWRLGGAPADRVVIELIRALVKQNDRLFGMLKKAAAHLPMGEVVRIDEQADPTPIMLRTIPPAPEIKT